MVNAILHAYPNRSKGPGEVLGHLNRHLAAKALESSFVTAFFGIFDPQTRQLAYALAGHDAPFRKSAQDGGSIDRLPDADGFPLGLMDDVTFEERAVTLSPGEVLFLFTDGITEATSPTGAMFGVKGILQHLAASTSSADEVIQQIKSGLLAHQAGSQPHDDQTMVALHVKA